LRIHSRLVLSIGKQRAAQSKHVPEERGAVAFRGGKKPKRIRQLKPARKCNGRKKEKSETIQVKSLLRGSLLTALNEVGRGNFGKANVNLLNSNSTNSVLNYAAIHSTPRAGSTNAKFNSS